MPALSPRIRTLLLLLTGISATILSGYLSYLSWQGRRLPIGCGVGSSCAEVLSSHWSTCLGIPVSGLACGLYAVFTLLICFAPQGSSSVLFDRLLAIAAGLIGGSIIWFISLQALVIRSFCMWCLFDHMCGAAFAMLLLDRVANSPTPDIIPTHSKLSLLFHRYGWHLGGGLLLAGAMATLQCLVPQDALGINRLAKDRNDDTGPGIHRQIAVLQGRLPLKPADEPMIGHRQATVLLVVMFDYCCPHCRKMHSNLLQAQTRYEKQLGIIALPTPLSTDCNPAVRETEPRFRESCTLARLALAVHRAQPDAFPVFDSWLFGPDVPRSAQEAQAMAVQLIGEKPLETALQDPWIDQTISRNVQAYEVGKIEALPVILSPGFPGIVGRTGTRKVLFELLERDLPLKPPKT